MVASTFGRFEGVDGRFWPVSNDYVVKVLAPGFQTYEQEAKFHYCRNTDLDITLKTVLSGRSKDGVSGKTDRVVVTGVVADSNHAAIKGVKVIAEGTDGKVFQAVTGKNGDYEISVPKGDYTLRYSGGRGWADRTLVNFVWAAELQTKFYIDITLEISSQGVMVSELVCEPAKPGKEEPKCAYVSRIGKSDDAILSGNVCSIPLAGIAGAKVTAGSGDGRVYSATADETGKYKLNLPKGKYNIAFEAEYFNRSVYKNFEVDETSLGERNLDMMLSYQAILNQ